MKGTKFAYDVEACLPLPLQGPGKISSSFDMTGAATAGTAARAHRQFERVAEAPMEWNICGAVQYTCIRQYGLDGRRCEVQVKGQRAHQALANKAGPTCCGVMTCQLKGVVGAW